MDYKVEINVGANTQRYYATHFGEEWGFLDQ